MFQGFPIIWGDGIDTIEIMGIHVENSSFDELEPEISLIKGGPGQQSGGWGLGQSGAPW